VKRQRLSFLLVFSFSSFKIIILFLSFSFRNDKKTLKNKKPVKKTAAVSFFFLFLN